MSDHPEIIEPIKKILEERRDAADKAANDDKEPFIPLDQVNEFANQIVNIRDVSVKRANAVCAIGFLEGFGAMLWNFVGPNLSDEEVAEYEKNVASIAEYIGLPPREDRLCVK